jgi:phenylacetate-CoA ligase
MTVTSLVHTAMPLVRYFTGDLVRVFAQPCSCGRAGRTAQVLGRYDDVIHLGNASISHYDLLDAAYDFADAVGSRVFFVVVLKNSLRLLVEVADPSSASRGAPEDVLRKRVTLPVQVEYLAYNDVMDRTALFRGPKIYKPSQISDWRGEGRKTITIMEALLEWPRWPWSTLMHLLRRQVKNAFRRRRFQKEDRQP